MSATQWITAALRGLFSSGCWLGPSLVMMVFSWFVDPFTAMWFIFAQILLLILHFCGFRYGLPPEYKVGSKLADCDNEEVIWKIVSISDNRKNLVMQLDTIHTHKVISNRKLEVSSLFARSEYKLINEHESIPA